MITFKTFRVCRPIKNENIPGIGIVDLPVGKLLKIDNINTVKKLMREGKICHPQQTHLSEDYKGVAAMPYTPRWRFGVFMHNSAHYSGGRIHMYQYCRTLANMGHTVYIASNTRPLWAKDYPAESNLHFLEGVGKMPADLDVVVTDPKNEWGQAALGYRRKHPLSRLVCFNFETPNWVKEFAPKTAEVMVAPHWNVFDAADYVICNSTESYKYFCEWLGYAKPGGVLWPGVNTFALDVCESSRVQIPSRPYVLYSSRSSAYKNGELVVDTIFGLDVPFDVVVVGHLQERKLETPLHKAHHFPRVPDVDKYKLMKNAHLVCAPSLFEGFGMVPGEALCSSTAVLATDLPVLRQNYGDRIIYAKWGDSKDYAQKLTELCKAPKVLVGAGHRERYGIEAMANNIGKLKHHPSPKRKKAFAHMIAYWGFLPESIKSVYDHVDEILIAYGRTPNALPMDDGSLERIKEFPDPDNKIKLEVREIWKSKLDMRHWCTQHASGNYQVIIDGDEVYVGLDKWLAADINYGGPRWVHFWHNRDYWIYDDGRNAGQRWGYPMTPFGSTNPHYRTSFWRPSMKFVKHSSPRDAGGGSICATDPKITAQVPDCWIAHFGHALPREIMKAKHDFYLKRDGSDPGRVQRMDAWHKWNGETGKMQDGIVSRVSFDLPEIVVQAFASMEEVKIRNEV